MAFLRSLCLPFLALLIATHAFSQEVPFFGILAPGSIAAYYTNGDGNYSSAAFGPGLSNGDVVAEVAISAEGDSLMCAATGDDFTNKIVLIPRGSCEFSLKMFNAQQQGAIGVIIVNFDETVISMAGGALGDSVTIPSVLVRKSIGDAMKAALQNGETVMVAFTNQPIGFSVIQGTIWNDLNTNCASDAGEQGLPKFVAVAEGANNKVYTALSQAGGAFSLYVDTINGPYSVALAPFNNLWSYCPATLSVPNAGSNDTTFVDFYAQALDDCPAMTVSISTPLLRRCFSNPFVVEACNLGTVAATGAYVLVDLDAWIGTPQNPSHPLTVEPDGRYRFDLGTMDVGACTTIAFSSTVNCDSAIIGQTLCYEAHVYPDTSCIQTSPAWSGATVSVTGQCAGDSIHFTIINSGTGAMSEILPYIVIEDDLMLQDGQFQLAPGEQTTISLPANGATWRLEADQEAYHPIAGTPAATVEGCTTNGSFSTGYFLMFPVYDPSQSVDVECQEVIGSWDPNDKRALPRGYGDAHYISPETGLDYYIRFQNTGTDTAFTVIVRDTLSTYLDPATIRLGASSHPFQLNILQGNILEFRFENILLVDSFKNEPASHGFLKFHVAQRPGNAWGTIIRNSAAIYFDFNPPVITNEVIHELGYLPHVSAVPDRPGPTTAPVRVYPNPAHATADIYVDQPLPAGARWRLLSPAGVNIQEGIMDGQRLRLSTPGLLPGLYWLEWQAEGLRLGGTKLMIRY